MDGGIGWRFQLKKERLLDVEGNPIKKRHNDRWVGETWRMYFIMKKLKSFLVMWAPCFMERGAKG
jgi:hypothetical protein